jgi:hypothetical protein
MIRLPHHNHYAYPRLLREALQHIVNHPEKDKVWFTRPSAIYDHCASLLQGAMQISERIPKSGFLRCLLHPRV